MEGRRFIQVLTTSQTCAGQLPVMHTAHNRASICCGIMPVVLGGIAFFQKVDMVPSNWGSNWYCRPAV